MHALILLIVHSRVIWQWTPASVKFEQLTGLWSWGQSTSLSSVPTHWTLSRRIGPDPCPKLACARAVASVDIK